MPNQTFEFFHRLTYCSRCNGKLDHRYTILHHPLSKLCGLPALPQRGRHIGKGELLTNQRVDDSTGQRPHPTRSAEPGVVQAAPGAGSTSLFAPRGRRDLAGGVSPRRCVPYGLWGQMPKLWFPAFLLGLWAALAGAEDAAERRFQMLYESWRPARPAPSARRGGAGPARQFVRSAA